MTAERRGVKLVISGRVQGVGFRYWARQEAGALGLAGWVRNRADGRVEAAFCGPAAAVERMIEACRAGPTFAAVREVEIEDWADTSLEGFQIRR